MSDRSATTMSIGGWIGRADEADDLIDAIEIENCGPDWDECFSFDATTAAIAQFLLDTAAAGEPLHLYRTETPWGKFDTLEETCVEHRIEFHRSDDGHYAYSPSNRAFRWVDYQWRDYEVGGACDEPAIYLEQLRQAIERDELATRARLWVAVLGSPVPPLKLSDDVRLHLAKIANGIEEEAA